MGLVGLYSKATLKQLTTRSEDPRHTPTCGQQQGCCHPARLLPRKQSTPQGVNKGSALSYPPKDRKVSSSFIQHQDNNNVPKPKKLQFTFPNVERLL